MKYTHLLLIAALLLPNTTQPTFMSSLRQQAQRIPLSISLISLGVVSLFGIAIMVENQKTDKELDKKVLELDTINTKYKDQEIIEEQQALVEMIAENVKEWETLHKVATLSTGELEKEFHAQMSGNLEELDAAKKALEEVTTHYPLYKKSYRNLLVSQMEQLLEQIEKLTIEIKALARE